MEPQSLRSASVTVSMLWIRRHLERKKSKCICVVTGVSCRQKAGKNGRKSALPAAPMFDRRPPLRDNMLIFRLISAFCWVSSALLHLFDLGFAGALNAAISFPLLWSRASVWVAGSLTVVPQLLVCSSYHCQR